MSLPSIDVVSITPGFATIPITDRSPPYHGTIHESSVTPTTPSNQAKMRSISSLHSMQSSSTPHPQQSTSYFPPSCRLQQITGSDGEGGESSSVRTSVTYDKWEYPAGGTLHQPFLSFIRSFVTSYGHYVPPSTQRCSKARSFDSW
eukprot:scaffold2566_cov125-Alexandrium_tamarense.AAC.32